MYVASSGSMHASDVEGKNTIYEGERGTHLCALLKAINEKPTLLIADRGVYVYIFKDDSLLARSHTLIDAFCGSEKTPRTFLPIIHSIIVKT